MAPIDYFVMSVHFSSVEYVRVTHTLGMACALDRGQHGLLGADTVLQQWNFPTFSAASSRGLGTVVLSLLFFFSFMSILLCMSYCSTSTERQVICVIQTKALFAVQDIVHLSVLLTLF